MRWWIIKSSSYTDTHVFAVLHGDFQLLEGNIDPGNHDCVKSYTVFRDLVNPIVTKELPQCDGRQTKLQIIT